MLLNRWDMLFVTTITAMFFAVNTLGDPQDLINDGWVLSNEINPADPALLADVVVDSIDYPWATDTLVDGRVAFHLNEGDRAYYRFADQPVYGKVEMLVYDSGASSFFADNTFGPRWGVQNNPIANPVPAEGTRYDQYMGVEITWNNAIDGNATYSFVRSQERSLTMGHDNQTWPGENEGLSFGEDAYRRVSGTLATGVSTDQTPVHVQGGWAKWTFEVHYGSDMVISVSDPDGSNLQQWTVIPMFNSVFDTGFSTTGFNQLFFYGGNTLDYGTTDHTNLWVDQIVFTADAGQPATDFTLDFEQYLPDPEPCFERAAEGDFDCNAIVDLVDLVTLGENYNQSGLDPETSYLLGDTNADGIVDLVDLVTLGEHFNQSTSIPEPAIFTMLLFSGLIVTSRRR